MSFDKHVKIICIFQTLGLLIRERTHSRACMVTKTALSTTKHVHEFAAEVDRVLTVEGATKSGSDAL